MGVGVEVAPTLEDRSVQRGEETTIRGRKDTKPTAEGGVTGVETGHSVTWF